MNYIPGFSNYLQTAIPRYARGGSVMDGEPMMYDMDRYGEPMMYDMGGYNEPVYQQPVYQEPVYQEPMYQEPVYQQPVYQEPYYEPYQYQQPVYQQPAYAEPSYTPAAEQPYVEPYTPAAEQPYVEPYVAPTETPYVPGFTNYLEASTPPYVAPAEAAAPYAEPYQPAPAAQPMTQEAAPAEVPFDINSLAGLDFSGLNNLYGMNFASDFGGGAMGGQYEADPNLQYISAPLSNKGNATSQTGGNTFAVKADQPVRLIDHRTNQVVFEGSGFDAARKATELGQGLTDQFGRKANYSIQTADPTGNYSTVAYEKKNKSTLGQIANVAGTVLPLAMIPLTMGMSAPLAGLSTAGKIALGAGLGGLGSGLKGQNVLKGAAMGGLSAAGGQLLGPVLGPVGNMGLRAGTAIGTGLGATAGGLATGQSLKNSLLGGVASGALSYVTPDIVKGLGINQAPTPTSASGSSPSAPSFDGILVNATPAITPTSVGTSLGGSPNKIQKALGQGAEAPYDGLTVTGSKIGGLSAVNLGGNQFGAPGEDVSAFDRLTDTADPNEILVKASPLEQAAPVSVPVTDGLSPDVLAGMAEFEKNPIISEGSKIEQPASGTFVPTDLGVIDRVSGMENYKEPIVVEGSKIERPEPTSVSVLPPLDPLPPLDLKPDPALTDRNKLGVEEYLRLLSLVAGLADAGGGKGSAGRYTPGGGRLNPIFSAKLPSAGGLGTIGATRTARPLGDEDWLTYGTRPELNFFDYAPRAALPTPVTTPMPGNPAGPIMNQNDPMRFAKGGKAKGGLSYEELSPEEKNFVDYHRRSLLVNPYERDGNISTVVGAVNEVPEGEMLYPTYVHGKMMDPNSARDWALRSGIDFPVYPDAETALARERMIHDNIIEPETARYAQGERKFLQERAKGGRSTFAVNGPGTGRSDDIPAVLSDGEYVIDAETVALLGDGSSKAGAKKLDDLRVKVRKHKGQKLAKGRFSANAKKPEAYLSGGRI